MDRLLMVPRQLGLDHYSTINYTDFINPKTNRFDYEYCNILVCSIRTSNYNYVPSLPANSLFVGLFSLSSLCFLVQAFRSRKFIGFTIAMVLGCILEVLGYAGRIISHSNPWLQSGFLMQTICLTIAPAFFAAGIYLTMSRLVLTIGANNCRVNPLAFPRFFIPCDVISILLQAVGGSVAGVATGKNDSPSVGANIMVVGFAFQFLTLGLFILICTDFALRTLHSSEASGATDTALDVTDANQRVPWKFKVFVAALALATICIFIRTIYRVVQLAQGWEGPLIANEMLFVFLEGAMMVVAALSLNLFHPGWCFQNGYEESIPNLLMKQAAIRKVAA